MPEMRKSHSHRLRIGRVSEANRIYLLTTVCHEREWLFADLYLGRIVVQSMRQHHLQGYVNSLAFVVMPDHVHWLVGLPAGIKLSRLMQSFKSYTAREINHHCNTPGTRRWQAGFHDHALRHDEDILHAARYIVVNPLRAGLVGRLADYPLWDAVWV
jgi:REP element-mobilizing transposase RayT